MSGGYFDYKQWKILEISDSIQEILDVGEVKLSQEERCQFRKAIFFLKMAHSYSQCIDLLISSDIDSKLFFQRLEQATNPVIEEHGREFSISEILYPTRKNKEET